MTKPKTPPRKSLVPTIADKIRAAIVDAELDFGENLSEDTLASAFEVSRTPVREALNLLQMEGLVIIVPKSGTYVFTPTLEGRSQRSSRWIGRSGGLRANNLPLIPAKAGGPRCFACVRSI